MPVPLMPVPRRHEPRPCRHISVVRPVRPHSAGCLECLASGGGWTELWICLSCGWVACGWVACAGGSPNRHAKAHYEETDHPVAAPLGPGPRHRWCYVHQRSV
jgi:uncharacterized UBP type Zn finger protein